MVTRDEELFRRIDVEWPRRLLFIGSGPERPKPGWLEVPSIRTNNKTLGLFLDNPLFGIMTWPSMTWEGVLGVEQKLARTRPDDLPILFVFDNRAEPSVRQTLPHAWLIGTKDLYDTPAFAAYLTETERRGFVPHASTGYYMTLWLRYADVDEILIAGYSGYKGLTGSGVKEWKVSQPYTNVLGDTWCPEDLPLLQRGDPRGFASHNLDCEWTGIEAAIGAAVARGVKVEVAKE